MNEAVKRFVPEGWHTVTPKIFVNDPKELADFLRQVFKATGEYRTDRPTQIKLGDSIIMLSDTQTRRATTAFLYVYVSDVDATYERAIEGEARSIEKPFDTPYGDRRCMVEDKWGNTWQIATFKG